MDLALCRAAAESYRDLLAAGYAEEHTRGIQLHFLDLRTKLDAQQEIRALCDLIWRHRTGRIRQWLAESSSSRA